MEEWRLPGLERFTHENREEKRERSAGKEILLRCNQVLGVGTTRRKNTQNLGDYKILDKKKEEKIRLGGRTQEEENWIKE